MIRRAFQLLLAFLLSVVVGAGAANPAFAAPEEARIQPAPLAARPEVAEPAGGWVTVPGLYADVRGTYPDTATLTRLANHAATSLPALAKRLGIRPGATVEIYVVGSDTDFKRLQPGATPDWADGTAWPDLSLVFLRSPSIRPGNATALETVLDHELVHVLLGQAFGGRPVPRWLQEGYAQFFSGESAWGRSMDIAKNDYGLAPLPLAEVTRGFPKDAVRAHLAYAESADFVAWIAGRSGEHALVGLVADLAAGASVDDAVHAATGLSLEAANAAWLGTVPTAWPWYRWATNPNLWWATGAVALGVGAWRRRARAQQKIARWEAEEAARAAAILEAERRAWVEVSGGGLPLWVPAAPPRSRRVLPMDGR